MNAAIILMMATLSTGQTTRPNANSSLGTNLGPLKYWATEWVFTDAFKQSSPWLTACVSNVQPDCAWQTAWDTGEEDLLDLDANGWVRSLPAPGDAPTFWLARTVMFYGIDGHYPAGQYIVTYEGEGTLNYSGSAVKNVVASSPGRDVIDVTPNRDGIILELAATDPNHTGNYIRNIHVIMPGYESTYATTNVFHPTFLSSVERFKTLRFMMWMETNASTQSTWAARPRMTDARYSTTAGVPLEAMIALANRTGSDAWFNIPHQATDDYITQFANVVRTQLGANQKAYIEYSNEVWNGAPGFDQSRWAAQQGAAMWPTSGESSFTKQMNWFGLRTAQMCDLVKAAFGADRSRVVCVLGSQASTAWTASQAADCPLWTQGAPCSAHGIDAIASAPYFNVSVDGPGNRARLVAMTQEADGGLTSLFAELQTGGVLPSGYAGGSIAETQRRMAATAAVANARGLSFIGYEGGQHLADLTQFDPAIQDLFRAVNRDARMGAVYDAYLAGWRTSGGRLFCHYLNTSAYGDFGPFGAREWLGQPATAKSSAIDRFLTANPQWWTSAAPTPVANNPAPTLTSLSPTQASVGGASLTLTLTGTNFITGSSVSFGGTSVVATTVSATRITAVIPAASLTAAASMNVTVSNPAPGGGTSAAQTFSVVRPLYYSIRNATLSVPGLGGVANEDIIRYDRVTGTKTLFFDGSVAASVLGAANIDAFYVNPDGTILMSFDVRVTIPAMFGDTVAQPADIVMYNPATRAWTFYFDGSDVGLSTAGENIDGLALLPDGRMLISTTGAGSVAGVAAFGGEDIIAFSPTGLGVNTTGTWAPFFDGSAVGLSGTAENVDAIATMGDGSILISTTGAAAVSGGLRFTGDDMVRFVPTALGTATAGSFSVWQQATGAGISGGVDGLQY